jgi:hypothetical protein
MTYTYTERKIETGTVTKAEEAKDGAWLTTSNGGTHFAPSEVAARLPVGTEFDLEMYGFNWIAGWRLNGEWLERRSDEYFALQREKASADFKRRNQERLDANRELWQAQEDALPDWLRARLVTFHIEGGENFAREGWGYELIICRLAEAYVNSNLEDDDVVNEISRVEGTSGNQHGMAKAIARAHLEDPDRSMAETISALSPISGSPFYKPTED